MVTKKQKPVLTVVQPDDTEKFVKNINNVLYVDRSCALFKQLKKQYTSVALHENTTVLIKSSVIRVLKSERILS